MQKVQISAYYDSPHGNEENIKRIVASIGPVAVAIDASQWGFAHYSSGIYNDPYCNNQKVNRSFIQCRLCCWVPKESVIYSYF